MFYAASRAVRAAIGVSAIALAVASAPTVQAQKAAPQSSTGLTPNYELAAAWTTQRVSRLVFDTSVPPRWLETSDRFWYSYNTREGRRLHARGPGQEDQGATLRPREDGGGTHDDHGAKRPRGRRWARDRRTEDQDHARRGLFRGATPSRLTCTSWTSASPTPGPEK